MKTTIGSRGPNVAVDDTTIDNGMVMVAKMVYNFTVACIPLATFADPCSVISWLLHWMPLFLLFASVCFSLATFEPPCFVIGWLLCCALLLLLFTFAVPCFPFGLC
jgi:hypothetical protein